MEVQSTYTFPNGEKHGLVNYLDNSCPDRGFTGFKEKDRESMKKLKAKEEKWVKARYVHINGGVNPNEQMCKPYMHWEGEPIQMWRCIHNHCYLIPQGLVDEVNGNEGLAVRENSEVVDMYGRLTVKGNGKPQRTHFFYPLEF